MSGKVDESKWDRAKAAAKKQYPELGESSRFYKIVSTIYKNMGGKFSKKAEKSLTDVIGILEHLEKSRPGQIQERHAYQERIARPGGGYTYRYGKEHQPGGGRQPGSGTAQPQGKPAPSAAARAVDILANKNKAEQRRLLSGMGKHALSELSDELGKKKDGGHLKEAVRVEHARRKQVEKALHAEDDAIASMIEKGEFLGGLRRPIAKSAAVHDESRETMRDELTESPKVQRAESRAGREPEQHKRWIAFRKKHSNLPVNKVLELWKKEHSGK